MRLVFLDCASVRILSFTIDCASQGFDAGHWDGQIVNWCACYLLSLVLAVAISIRISLSDCTALA